jgi:antirestriction protein ArdC
MQSKSERRDVAAEITAKIIEALERGTAPWRQPWATQGATVGGLPFSITSRRPYSGINVWLLMLAQQAAGFRSSGWLTFNAARKFGGHVRKGERGTLVTFWKTFKKTQRDESGKETTATIPMLRHFTAFNVDQVEELPAELLAKYSLNPERIATTEAAQWFASKLPGLRIEHGHAAAYYRPSEDAVYLPAREDFATEAAYFGTLAHECTHATGAESRLDRKCLANYATDKRVRAEEELVADIGASLIAARCGRDFDAGNHESYLASWAELLREDRKAILRAAAAAQRAVDFVCGAASEEGADESAAE